MSSSAGYVNKRILLTGPPGIGKTTLVQKVCKKLENCNAPLKGFYTEEVRSGGWRTGFDIVTMDGQRAPLARKREAGPKSAVRYAVGQYTVSLKSFEDLVLPVFQTQLGEVLVLDEIGRMELCSSSFMREVSKAFDNPNITILATIPVPRDKPISFVEKLRHHPNSTVITVDHSNRDSLVDKIVTMLQPIPT
ncbi:hypothetical protein L9F63_000286 [Diploptera punctata]|uniref:AAA+ ATPase domain-containing protein n=1 Tax=Diploptera punctata TaxID=6984 RepID=A0AAD8ESU1_DIPPU|nr:hypothetical protein L9F63_000286 [Diploptera punctata]